MHLRGKVSLRITRPESTNTNNPQPFVQAKLYVEFQYIKQTNFECKNQGKKGTFLDKWDKELAMGFSVLCLPSTYPGSP